MLKSKRVVSFPIPYCAMSSVEQPRRRRRSAPRQQPAHGDEERWSGGQPEVAVARPWDRARSAHSASRRHTSSRRSRSGARGSADRDWKPSRHRRRSRDEETLTAHWAERDDAFVPAPSRGSSQHPSQCRPCAFWVRNRSCRAGKDCKLCHLCPPSAFARSSKRARGKDRGKEAGRERSSRVCDAAAELACLVVPQRRGPSRAGQRSHRPRCKPCRRGRPGD